MQHYLYQDRNNPARGWGLFAEAAISDGNPNPIGDPNWLPVGAPYSNGGGTNFTPPFPAYASGHATFGAALFQTMTRFYGTNKISFTIGSDEYNGITTETTLQPRQGITLRLSAVQAPPPTSTPQLTHYVEQADPRWSCAPNHQSSPARPAL